MFGSDPSTPDPARLSALVDALSRLAPRSRDAGPWESGAFELFAGAGLLAGFVPADAGGTGASEGALLDALVAVASACLTGALALTQWASACRIVALGPAELRARMLPRLARGDETTTVGIAQLTTSRRHLGAPALRAVACPGGTRLRGTCPWVTGADAVDTIVTGGECDDGTTAFFVVPAGAAGLTVGPPLPLVALAGSRTAAVGFDDVAPAATIRPEGAAGARTGGLATTALALGAARGSLALLRGEAAARLGLGPAVDGFAAEIDRLAGRLRAAGDDAGTPPEVRDALRTAATGLCLRVAQGALVAAKGAGFVTGHPAGRAATEALLFLVWSCPHQVASAVLCDLAQLDAPA